MAGPVEPYLKIGTICERVMQEKDNVLSIIRVVDKFTIGIIGKEPPDKLPRSATRFTILMIWVGGLGTHEAAFNIVSPDGSTQPSPQSWSFNLDSLNGGHNIIVEMQVEIGKAGVYWVEFQLNGAVKSRIPFQVIYSPQRLRS